MCRLQPHGPFNTTPWFIRLSLLAVAYCKFIKAAVDLDIAVTLLVRWLFTLLEAEAQRRGWMTGYRANTGTESQLQKHSRRRILAGRVPDS